MPQLENVQKPIVQVQEVFSVYFSNTIFLFTNMGSLPCSQVRITVTTHLVRNRQGMSETDAAATITGRAKWLNDSRAAISEGDKCELQNHLTWKVSYY